MLACAMAEPVHPATSSNMLDKGRIFLRQKLESQSVQLISGISVKSCTYNTTGP